MAAKLLPVAKLATKLTIAGGAIYVAYDSGILGNSEEGSVALGKAKAAIPPAVDEWAKYFGLSLPTIPNIEFAPLQAWNSGVQKSIHALSMAPTRAGEATSQGVQYVKNLAK
ncbi:MICOS complex subunit MIC13 [Engraulis encrasicolus]|uniref:MICOS complex subunit MIC13 n=1 Tax=Engraulis encrasicolus TaxID=184585 RepID=UPI002FD5405C